MPLGAGAEWHGEEVHREHSFSSFPLPPPTFSSKWVLGTYVKNVSLKGAWIVSLPGFSQVWLSSVFATFSSPILLECQRRSLLWGRAVFMAAPSHLVQKQRAPTFPSRISRARATTVSGSSQAILPSNLGSKEVHRVLSPCAVYEFVWRRLRMW